MRVRVRTQRFQISRRSLPSTSSMAMNSSPAASPASNVDTRFACDSRSTTFASSRKRFTLARSVFSAMIFLITQSLASPPG